MLLACIWLAAGITPDSRAWGVHFLAFLPRPVWIASAAVFAVLVDARVAGACGRALQAGTQRLFRARFGIALGAAAAGIVFALLRLRYPFLGDGVVWLEKIESGNTFHHFEPLATFVVRGAARVWPTWKPATQLTAIACGVLWWVATATICRRTYAGDPRWRGAVFALVILNPVLLLWCGYVESYPLLLAVQALLIAFWSRDSMRGKSLVTVLIAGVAIAVHLQAACWLPALAWIASRGAATPLRAGRAAALAVLGAVTIGAMTIAVIGASPLELLAALRGGEGIGGWTLQSALSWRRALDVVNEIALLGGAALVLSAATWRARIGWRWLREPRWTPVALLALGAAAIWLVPPRIGAARDWDLYVAVVLPAFLIAGEAARRAVRAWPATRCDALVGRSVGLAAIVTFTWVASQVDDARAAKRFVVLQDAHGTFSNFARGYANEALGMYYRTRDVGEAHAAYARAVQNNPNNPRYWNNLAMHEVMRQNYVAAVSAWRRALDLGMHHWYVYYNLAMAELELQNVDAALALGEDMVRRWPGSWQAWMGRGRARLQAGDHAGAAPDLERAWRLEPRQPEIGYALGLAQQSQGDTAAAAATFAAVLRLDPRHPGARRELDRIEGRLVPPAPGR